MKNSLQGPPAGLPSRVLLQLWRRRALSGCGVLSMCVHLALAYAISLASSPGKKILSVHFSHLRIKKPTRSEERRVGKEGLRLRRAVCGQCR